mmetsp:Transcript_35640/g.107222  ORF Transcript_35640/g.107222 Transcript_35640/m.107222 type:complete len:319 (-) Transcript_35640:347-1303(-)
MRFQSESFDGGRFPADFRTRIQPLAVSHAARLFSKTSRRGRGSDLTMSRHCAYGSAVASRPLMSRSREPTVTPRAAAAPPSMTIVTTVCSGAASPFLAFWPGADAFRRSRSMPSFTSDSNVTLYFSRPPPAPAGCASSVMPPSSSPPRSDTTESRRGGVGAAAAAAAASLVDGYVSISLSGKDASERLLRECSASRMVHVARLLAIDGVDVDVRDSAGRTALMVGASHGVEPVVAALVDAGAAVDAVAPDGSTATFAASSRGHADALQALIQGGGDVDKPRRDGATPAYAAAYWGHAEALGLLLDAGCDADRAASSCA